MPLFALGLNFAWEVLYSLNDLVIHPTTGGVQGIVNLVWACFDLIIVYTYFKYGKKFFPEKAKKYFVVFSLLAFISCFAIQLAFFFNFPAIPAARPSPPGGCTGCGGRSSGCGLAWGSRSVHRRSLLYSMSKTIQSLLQISKSVKESAGTSKLTLFLRG